MVDEAASLTITIAIWIGLSNTQFANLNQNLYKYEETAMLSKERATHLLNPPLPEVNTSRLVKTTILYFTVSIELPG